MPSRSTRLLSRRLFATSALVLAMTACAKRIAPAGEPQNIAPPASAVEGEQLTLATPLTLERRSAARGETIVGRVTYANDSAAPITVSNMVIIARHSGVPGGGEASFSPGLGVKTIPPGQRVTLTATFALADTTPGQWHVSSRYQDSSGAWHDAPDERAVAFVVPSPGPLAGGTAPAALAAGVSATPTPAPAQTLERISPLYWGAYIDGVPWDLARLDAFEARARKSVSLVHWGQPWWREGRYQPFYPNDFERVRRRGALPLLDWGSWDYSTGSDQPAFALAAITRGDHDAFIRAWAAGARDWGHPLFLRFDWEMNGWWQFPWSERLNGNRPGEYVAAWRHVHDLFAQVGATNVTWVWCPNAINVSTTPLTGLYPGDDYVDWVAMDGYNWGNDYGNVWQSFAEVFGPTYGALRQLAPTKPIMIAETGCQERGGDKAAWIRDALSVQLPACFPAVKAVAWFNWDDDDAIQTAVIESSGAASLAFGAAIGGSPTYLPNRFANFDVSPIPPPGP